MYCELNSFQHVYFVFFILYKVTVWHRRVTNDLGTTFQFNRRANFNIGVTYFRAKCNHLFVKVTDDSLVQCIHFYWDMEYVRTPVLQIMS